MRHVWFITAIMCAYLITPILQKVRTKSHLALLFFLVIVTLLYMVSPSLKYVFVFSWVYLYAIGYLYVNLCKEWKSFYFCLFILVMIIVFTNFQLEDLRNYYGLEYRLLHDICGVVFVIVGVRGLSYLKKLNVPPVISFFDKYSFYIFLVHFIIFCGPFSMAHITSHIGLNILLMLLTTCIVTFGYVRLVRLVNTILNI